VAPKKADYIAEARIWFCIAEGFNQCIELGFRQIGEFVIDRILFEVLDERWPTDGSTVGKMTGISQ
jgi:hypothetical protein